MIKEIISPIFSCWAKEMKRNNSHTKTLFLFTEVYFINSISFLWEEAISVFLVFLFFSIFVFLSRLMTTNQILEKSFLFSLFTSSFEEGAMNWNLSIIVALKLLTPLQCVFRPITSVSSYVATLNLLWIMRWKVFWKAKKGLN